MGRPKLIDEATQDMRDAVARATPHISAMVKVANQDWGIELTDLCIQISAHANGIKPAPGRIVADDVVVMPCCFSGFRKIPGAMDNPVLRKLVQMEHDQPGDLPLLLTHDDTGYIGWAIKDFGLSPLTIIGAL